MKKEMKLDVWKKKKSKKQEDDVDDDDKLTCQPQKDDAVLQLLGKTMDTFTNKLDSISETVKKGLKDKHKGQESDGRNNRQWDQEEKKN